MVKGSKSPLKNINDDEFRAAVHQCEIDYNIVTLSILKEYFKFQEIIVSKEQLDKELNI